MVQLFSLYTTRKTTNQQLGKKTNLVPLSFADEWNVSTDDNALTLDYCDVYFDGKPEYENLPIGDVQEKALAFERAVNTKLTFTFDVKDLSFSKCELVCETKVETHRQRKQTYCYPRGKGVEEGSIKSLGLTDINYCM